jgi:hypothetical protein
MKVAKIKTALSAKQRDQLLATLQSRFEKNPGRHACVDWANVAARLNAHPGKLWPLSEM